MKRAGFTSIQGLDLPMAKRNLKQEMKNYYNIWHMATSQRDTFLELLANVQAKSRNLDAAK